MANAIGRCLSYFVSFFGGGGLILKDYKMLVRVEPG
jgi:hypothetical protein